MKKIHSILLFILNSKFVFKKPKPVDILIYDRIFSEYIELYLKPFSHDVLQIRGQSLNLFILFKLIFKFPTKNFLHEYIKMHIETVKPKIIITGNDNDIKFFKLKNQIKNINFKTIAIQNGYRTLTAPDIINYYKDFKDKDLLADYFLCFNDEVGKLYQKLFNCKSLTIGSFLNNINFKNKKQKKQKKKLFWVSQYRYIKNHKDMIDESNLTKNQKINFINYNIKEFYDVEKKILPLIFDFCKKNEIEFGIISSCLQQNTLSIQHEKEFYEKILINKNWKMSKNEKKNKLSVYSFLDKEVDYLVHAESTLGYESLSRGIRTITFLSRKSNYSDQKYKFGWPNNFELTGKIWSNKDNELEVERLLEYIFLTNDKEWTTYLNTIKDKVMYADKDNQIFQSLIKDLMSNYT